jgi:hypothetical protein
VREQAQALIDSAETATDTEVRQVVRLGQQETDEMAGRFHAHAIEVVQAIAKETADEYVRRGIR